MKRLSIIILFVMCLGTVQLVLAESWEPTGGPTGGYVLCLAVHPTNPNIVYAGTQGGYVYKTTDGGTGWERKKSFGSDVLSLAIDPQNHTTVYAGTEAVGLWKTTDSGESWAGPYVSNNPITALIVDPSDSCILYAGVYGEGVYKSIDCGSNWDQKNVGLTDDEVLSLAIDPTNPQVLYAGTDGYIFKTEDGAETWVYKKYFGRDVFCIVVDPLSHNVVYAGTEYEVRKSIDSGDNWDNCGPTAREVHSLDINPIFSSILYAGTDAGVYKTASGCGSWAQIFTPPGGTIVTAVGVSPSSPDTVYVGCDGEGVFKTTDGGSYWDEVNSRLLNMTVYKVAAHPTQSNILFAGTEIGGIYKSTDGGESWGLEMPLRNVVDFAFHPDTPETIWAATYGEGVYKSLDGGDSWGASSGGLDYSCSKRVWDITVNPFNPCILYIATDCDAWKSADCGLNWTRTDLTSGRVYSVLCDPTESQTVYAGRQGHLYKSTDGGSNWQDCSDGIESNDKIKALAANPDFLYAGGGYIDHHNNPQGGIYITQIGNCTWTKVLDNVYCSEIVSNPACPDTMYASSFNSGIYRSTTGGFTWEPFNGGLPDTYREANTIAVNANGEFAFAGFSYGSVWKTSISCDVVKEIDQETASSFHLYQNYPNPFNPNTSIEFLLSKSGQVKIEIFNILGQKVKTLVDQYLKAGHKLVDWDGKDNNGNDVSSGIYFYRLQAGDYVDTKRMVLLK